VRGKLEKKDGRVVIVRVNILNELQQLCASSRVTYFIPKRETILNILGTVHPSFTEYLD
jgi:acyl-coenzyme A thioesterase PaaI-like protein